jgi:hypothetical protein
MAAPERTAVLVIRAWLEEGALRARITRRLDISSPTTVASAATLEQKILGVVRVWLLEFSTSADDGDGQDSILSCGRRRLRHAVRTRVAVDRRHDRALLRI